MNLTIGGRTFAVNENIAKQIRAARGLVATEPKPQSALERQSPPTQRGKLGIGGSRPVLRVSIIALTKRTWDGDNITGGCKPMRDAIAQRLGLDDADSIIEWEYGQCRTRGQTGTVVIVEET